MKNSVLRFVSAVSFLLSFGNFSAAKAQLIVPSEEQPNWGWLQPADYGTVQASFEVSIPTNTMLTKVTLRIMSGYTCITNFGRMLIFDRPETDWRTHQ